MHIGKEPDELILTSPDIWTGVNDTASPYEEFLISKVTESVDVNDAAAKRHAIDRLAPVLQLVPDAVTRSHYAQLIGRRLDLPFRDVQARLQRSAPPAMNRPGAKTASQEQTPTLQIEDHLIALLIKHRELSFDLSVEVPPDEVMDARNRTLLGIVRDSSLPDDYFGSDFLASLDPVLAEHARQLIESIDNRPSQLPGEVREEVLQTLMRLERERYDLLSAHLRSEIATAEAARDQDLLPTLLAQYDRLSLLHKRTYPPLSPYFTDSRTRTPLKKPRSFSR
jgi:DNA primase